jgi:hypothetical protein
MNKSILCMGVLLAFSTLTYAGEIYGTITEGGKSVGEGVALEVKCGAKVYPAKTDRSGTYHVAVQEKGKCALTLQYKSQTPSLEIASYEEGVQVDLVLEMKDGKYVARRK